jgi:hypothetical protein
MHIRSRALAVVLLAGLVACGPQSSPSPTVGPSPSPGATVEASPSPTASQADAQAVYAAIASQVEAIRGLRPKADVRPVIIDEATLRKNLEADFDRSNPAAAVETSQRTLIALGLIPPASSLRALVLDLQSGQVAGYYSPPQDELFVVSRAGGGLGALQRATYAHEFTHQLQDQNFNLDGLKLESPDQGDRSLGRLALVEGDATATQATWMGSELSAAELGELLAAASDPAALAALQRAPSILRETAFFPYQAGLAFVQGLISNGGYEAVDGAFNNPPDSTEQILHPEKYAAGEKPVAISLPTTLAAKMGIGWKAVGPDTLGELNLRIWLTDGGVASGLATAAAAGWGGDRLQLLEGPGGADVVAMATAWDSPADATDFAAAASTALTGHALHGTVIHTAGSTRVSIVIGANVAVLVGVMPG